MAYNITLTNVGSYSISYSIDGGSTYKDLAIDSSVTKTCDDVRLEMVPGVYMVSDQVNCTYSSRIITPTAENASASVKWTSRPDPPIPPGPTILTTVWYGIGQNQDICQEYPYTVKVIYESKYTVSDDEPRPTPSTSYIAVNDMAPNIELVAQSPIPIQDGPYIYLNGENVGSTYYYFPNAPAIISIDPSYDIYITETPPSYSITYHANGGTPVPEDLTDQTTIPDPLPTISKYGYQFGGWYTDSEFTNEAIAGNPISNDTDLYAKFVIEDLTGFSWSGDSENLEFDNSGEFDLDFKYNNKDYEKITITSTGLKFDDELVAGEEPAVTPVKGDIISMNLDGTDRDYRILNLNGNIAEVVAMFNANTSCMFNVNAVNLYSGGELDTYLNTTWYGGLTSIAKNAIVDKTFTQDSWYYGASGSPVYNGYYGTTKPGASAYRVSLGNSAYKPAITRHVYALSVQDVINYVTDTSVGDGQLQNYNIWKMFWNDEVQHEEYPWLRSADPNYYIDALYVNGWFGYMRTGRTDSNHVARPAFTIDLSKIDWTPSNQ